MMRVGIAADHGGLALKGQVAKLLRGSGHEVVDFGAHELDPGDDYPDFIIPLARAVAAGEVERGVALCGSGVGASIAANKIPGVRAGLIHDVFSAHQGVEDDDMNVFCLGGKVIGSALAGELIETFLAAHFSGAERHNRRLAKVQALENSERQQCGGSAGIEIYPDLETLSVAAAQLFAEQAERAVETQGRFSVAFSGGSTPRRVYELLSQPPFRDRVPWAKVHVFWGDERCVPVDDPRSNYRLARLALLDHVPIPTRQIHPILCPKEPREAAECYEAILRASFTSRPARLDLVFLGLGENGHTASLFPDTPVLEERHRWVAEVGVAGQDVSRVTLTAILLNRAVVVAFLVAGAAKAAVLEQVLEGPRDPSRLPAQLIRPSGGELRWLVDRAAASLISHNTMERPFQPVHPRPVSQYGAISKPISGEKP